MPLTVVSPGRRAVTAASFGCLVAQVPWLMLCWLARQSDPSGGGPAGPAWLLIAGIGSFALSLLGSIVGRLSPKNGRAGMIALELNALVCLGVGVFLLSSLGPLR